MRTPCFRRDVGGVGFALLALLAPVTYAKPQAKPVTPAPSATPPAPTPSPATPRPPEAQHALAIKWLRDSGEYAALTRMVYGFAASAVAQAADAARQAGESAPLAAVLDVDETTLDNSVYQLERTAYGLSYDDASWDAWVERRAAGSVPGVADFVREARAHGLRLVWLSNRAQETAAATRDNLAAFGLWAEGDALCLQVGDQDARKSERRAQVRNGQGACSLGAPARVLVYVGDQLGDFPADGEETPESRRAECFGRRCFVLPNPMYGSWARGVTRPLP